MLDFRSPWRAAGVVGAWVALALAQRPEPACAQRSEIPAAPIEIVFDASVGMGGGLEEGEKIEVARRFVRALREELAAGGTAPSLGLRVYGDSPRGPSDCRDSRLLVSAAEAESDFDAALEAVRPQGAAPLAYALERALADTARTYVLVTQGTDTCAGDACGAWRPSGLPGTNRGTRLHVVALAPRPEELDGLKCLSRAGSGTFHSISSAAEADRAAARLALILRNEGRLDVRLSLGAGEPFLAPVRLLVPRTRQLVAAFPARGPRAVAAGIYRVVIETAPPITIERVMILPGETVTIRRSDFGRLQVEMRDDEDRPLRAPFTVRAGPRRAEVRYALTGEAVVLRSGTYDVVVDLGDSLVTRSGVSVPAGRTARVVFGGRGTVRVVSPEFPDPPPTRAILTGGASADTLLVGESASVPAGRYRLRVETLPIYVSDDVSVGYGETTTVELPPLGTLRFDALGPEGPMTGVPARLREPRTGETYGVVLSGEPRLVMPGTFRLDLETAPPQTIGEVVVRPDEETVVERQGLSRIFVAPATPNGSYRLEVRDRPHGRRLAEARGPAPSVAASPGSYHARVFRGSRIVWEGSIAVAFDEAARIDLPRPQ